MAKNHAVVIVGGGPTGLMLAGELALARIDVVIVERRENQDLVGARAGGLHARSLEVLDQRGIAERFISQGQAYPFVGFAQIRLPFADFPTRHNYLLGLKQRHIERILGEWVSELGVPIRRGCEVTDLEQDAEGVNVALADGSSIRARYLVGCDGGRSLVRKKAGIDFPGSDPTASWLIAEIELTDKPEFGIRRDKYGVFALGPHEDGKQVGAVLREEEMGKTGPPTIDEIRASLRLLYGTDYGLTRVSWASRFTDMARQAAAYRAQRVLVAGDAAHVHPPMGGQGLNVGLQDAVNLGWKLALVVNGHAPEALLDSYHAERHPVGARVLKNTMAQTALSRGDDRMDALRAAMSELLQLEEARKRYAGMMSGLDIHYDLGPGHPLLGRRMPDLELELGSQKQRVFALLHGGKPVLLELAPSAFDLTPWGERVHRVRASYAGVWELPVLGAVPPPHAVLIRPDGHVAWVGDGTDRGLGTALSLWFGSASPASQ